MLSHAEFKASLLKILTPNEVDAVLPLIEKQILDSKQEVKQEAIGLVKGFFPDPHDGGDNCSDCLIIESLAETLDVYIPVRLVEESNV